VNVPALLTAIILPLFVSGCASFGWQSDVKPLDIQKRAVERTPLKLPDPPPVQARELEWIIITPENAESVWQRLRDANTDVVLFALTDDGYEMLALTMAELRNFVAQQRAITRKYREYYEPAPAVDETKK
jgi:outer membrane PBP1 activator LpoA protein